MVCHKRKYMQMRHDKHGDASSRAASDGVVGGGARPPSPRPTDEVEDEGSKDQEKKRRKKDGSDHTQESAPHVTATVLTSEEAKKDDGFEEFYCLLMSQQAKPRYYIPRQSGDPLLFPSYINQWKQWPHWLAGVRTYLPPPKVRSEKGDSKNRDDISRVPKDYLKITLPPLKSSVVGPEGCQKQREKKDGSDYTQEKGKHHEGEEEKNYDGDDDGDDDDGISEDFICLYISQQPNFPYDIPRQDCKPLGLGLYLALLEEWSWLLDGRRTYLRLMKVDCETWDGNCSNDDFQVQKDRPKTSLPPLKSPVAVPKGCQTRYRRPLLGQIDLSLLPETLKHQTPYLSPHADQIDPSLLPKTLGCQKPVLALVSEYEANNEIIQQKIKLLCEKYAFFRRTRGDGSCFYQSFYFSYMEHLIQMQDVQVEVACLMECVARSMANYLSYGGSEAKFSDSILEFKDLVNSVANGLTTEDLYQRSLWEDTSSRILSSLRFLTEIEIRKREELYMPFFPPADNSSGRYATAFQFCMKEVRPSDSEADQVQIIALSNALVVPLRVEYLDSSLHSGVAQVNHHDFFPQLESGSGLYLGSLCSSERSSSQAATSTDTKPLEQPNDSDSTEQAEAGSSGTATRAATKPLEQPNDSDSSEQAGASTSGNLLSSDGTPLVTLLYRPGHYDILYRK